MTPLITHPRLTEAMHVPGRVNNAADELAVDMFLRRRRQSLGVHNHASRSI